jgi:hypothetical protein
LQKHSSLAKPRYGKSVRSLEKTMKKICHSLFALTLLLALFVPVLADTIKLKDGSVIHGQVVGFKDGQFTVLIGGSKGRRSRTTIYVEDVDSIEFDASTSGSGAAPTTEDASVPSNPTETAAQRPQSRPTPTPDVTDTNPPTTSTQPSSATPPTFFTIRVSVRADNTNNGWTNSGLVVRRGQRLRITASGRVSLGKGRFSTPAGVATAVDNDKLMRTEATGALIAVIGDDNDDFVFIGARREFVAQRDGVLFFGVNEGDLTDNNGSYDIVIEAEAGSNPPR